MAAILGGLMMIGAGAAAIANASQNVNTPCDNSGNAIKTLNNAIQLQSEWNSVLSEAKAIDESLINLCTNYATENQTLLNAINDNQKLFKKQKKEAAAIVFSLALLFFLLLCLKLYVNRLNRQAKEGGPLFPFFSSINPFSKIKNR
jgi:predicted PurR-regulated permease PerM